MARLGSGSGRRRPYIVPQVLDKKASTHHVLRAGLRALVVVLDPVLFRPRAQPYHRLRAFPRGGGAQRLLAGCRAHLLRGRVGWLVELLDDVLPLAPRSWPRWYLGGAGLQGLRSATAASRPNCTPCQPDPRGAVGLLAPAVRSNRGGHLG